MLVTDVSTTCAEVIFRCPSQDSNHPDDLFQSRYSMASSLESLLAHRRAKKAARFGGIIDHNLTDNNLNQHVNNTNASTNDIYYLMLHITPLPQLSHTSALAAKPNLPTFIWIILLLSNCPVALYLPTRYLSFHVGSHSAVLHDISTSRKFQPTFTTFLGACD